MDKEKQQLDTKFIDQSWQNMSELLDKEMPVQKRKRRFIWLWFLGLTALSVIVYAYHSDLFSKKNINHKIITKKVEKIAEKETLLIENPATNKEKNISSSQTIFDNKKLNQNAFDNKKSLLKNNLESSRNLLTPKASKAGTKTKKIDKLVPNNSSLEIGQLVENLGKIQKPAIVSPEKEINYQRWSNHNLPILSLPAFSLFFKQRPKETIPIIQPTDNKFSRWRFGLYGGGLTNKLGSFRAGLHSNLILNPKWTLHIGLGYAHRIKDNSSNNNEDELVEVIFSGDNTESNDPDDQNFPTTATGTGPSPGNPNPSPTVPVVNPPEFDYSDPLNFTKFQYFELPILFQYRLNTKWTLDFGGQIALLHGVHYKQNQESLFSTNPNNISINGLRSSTENRGIVGDINLTAIGGIAYQISPKLSAYSSYHFSSYYITNSFSSSDLEKRWQQIEVGVRYYFK